MSLSRRTFVASTLGAPAILTLAPGLIPAAAQSAPTTRIPATRTFRVGEIEITALYDGYITLPTPMLVGFDPALAEPAAKAAYRRYNPQAFTSAITGYLIRTGERLVAVDCGTPQVVGDTVGTWHDSLALAGIDPASIDTVFQTHLHMDHIGGLGEPGQGNKRLPNAQIIAAEAEWDFTHSDTVYAQAPDLLKGSFDLARALLAPYKDALTLIALQETDIAPGLTALPLPGHTPGHMGLRVTSGEETLLIWGDAIVAAAYQFAHPDWSLIIDADQNAARQIRTRLLDEAATDRLRIAGSHLDFPSIGYVERSGDGYRYIPSGADYG